MMYTEKYMYVYTYIYLYTWKLLNVGGVGIPVAVVVA